MASLSKSNDDEHTIKGAIGGTASLAKIPADWSCWYDGSYLARRLQWLGLVCFDSIYLRHFTIVVSCHESHADDDNNRRMRWMDGWKMSHQWCSIVQFMRRHSLKATRYGSLWNFHLCELSQWHWYSRLLDLPLLLNANQTHCFSLWRMFCSSSIVWVQFIHNCLYWHLQLHLNQHICHSTIDVSVCVCVLSFSSVCVILIVAHCHFSMTRYTCW